MRTVRVRLEYLPVCKTDSGSVYLPEVPQEETLWKKTCKIHRLTEENKNLKRWVGILLITLIVTICIAILR